MSKINLYIVISTESVIYFWGCANGSVGFSSVETALACGYDVINGSSEIRLCSRCNGSAHTVTHPVCLNSF
jgi:hypothetical protein